MTDNVRGEPPTWASEGTVNNPTAAAGVLADTGQLAAGAYLAQILISSDAAAALNLQWRNAANSANNKEQRLYYAANTRDGFIIHFRINAANERVRLIPNADVTGNVSASIIWQALA